MQGDLTPPTFWQAFSYWLKLGFISFGGPAGQMAIMHEELVVRKRWISERRFLHAMNYCMVLPGPEAQQLATYIGWLMHGLRGGLVAGGLFILPSLLLLMVLSWLYMAYGNLPAVAGAMYGIKPAVTAMVLSAAWRIGSRVLKNRLLWCMAGVSFVAIYAFHVPFPIIVLCAGALGYAGGKIAPGHFSVGNSHTSEDQVFGPAIIDDATPTPAHALFTWARFSRLLVVFLGIWLTSMAGLIAMFGWQSTLTQLGWFFTKAALMTFGGAYAVLPYVYQGAVDHFHWLTAPQMMAGLALGETTPGPLIMVVSFVGFVSGWSQALFGSDSQLLSGVVAAAVVTFFTFLPSFFFIFAGGPLIESTHGKLQFTSPLTGITAAVVGVIVNLAVYFAFHALWPQGLLGPFDWPAALIGLLAAWALIRKKTGVITVVGGSALLGWAISVASNTV